MLGDALIYIIHKPTTIFGPVRRYITEHDFTEVIVFNYYRPRRLSG